MEQNKPKSDEITGPPDKIIYRQGEGQVQIWYDAAGNVMHEKLATVMIDPKRPAKLTAAREKWLREWHRLFAPPADIKWPVPGWVIVAHAEMQSMYCPELRARYRNREQFAKDPVQIGLYCGSRLAWCAHAQDNASQLQTINRQIPDAAEAERSEPMKYVQCVLTKGSLAWLRLFADGFKRAVDHDPFYSASGRPVQGKRHNRFEALRFLIDNWHEVETRFVSKGKKRRDLHQWLVSKLKELRKPCNLTLKATQTLCDDIGLRLRPHSK